MRSRWPFTVAAALALSLVPGCGGDGHRSQSVRTHPQARVPEPPEFPIAWTWPAGRVEDLASPAGLRKLEHQRPLASTSWKGYVTLVLLEYLDEKEDVDLLSSRFDDVRDRVVKDQDITLVFLTADHRRRFGRRLARINPSRAQLRRFYEAFSEERAAGVGHGMRESLDIVRSSLRAANAHRVAVIELLD